MDILSPLCNVAQIISILSGKLGPLVFVNVWPKGVVCRYLIFQ